ncbi:hypothetical protein ACWKT3_00385 [Streptomyces violaceus]
MADNRTTGTLSLPSHHQGGRRLQRGFRLPLTRRQREAEQTLKDTAAAARPGQEQRIDQIIRSGLAAGLNKPLHSTGRRP